MKPIRKIKSVEEQNSDNYNQENDSIWKLRTLQFKIKNRIDRLNLLANLRNNRNDRRFNKLAKNTSYVPGEVEASPPRSPIKNNTTSNNISSPSPRTAKTSMQLKQDKNLSFENKIKNSDIIFENTCKYCSIKISDKEILDISNDFDNLAVDEIVQVVRKSSMHVHNNQKVKLQSIGDDENDEKYDKFCQETERKFSIIPDLQVIRESNSELPTRKLSDLGSKIIRQPTIDYGEIHPFYDKANVSSSYECDISQDSEGNFNETNHNLSTAFSRERARSDPKTSKNLNLNENDSSDEFVNKDNALRVNALLSFKKKGSLLKFASMFGHVNSQSSSNKSCSQRSYKTNPLFSILSTDDSIRMSRHSRRVSMISNSNSSSKKSKNNLLCRKCLRSGSICITTNWPYDQLLQNFVNSTPQRRQNPLTTTFFSFFGQHYDDFQELFPDYDDESADKLCRFMAKIEMSYQDVPYHSKIHACDVLAASNVLLNQLELSGLVEFTSLEKFTLLLAAACHDVGHPSVNSHYVFVNNKSISEIKNYGETGLLEKFHSQIALDFMDLPEIDLDIRKNEVFVDLFEYMILGTDMSKHNSKIDQLDSILKTIKSTKNYNDRKKYFSESKENRKIILAIILHIADLSNPAKNFDDAMTWGKKVCDEFFQQGDVENLENGKISNKIFDRKNVSLEDSQIGFITWVVKPLVDKWCELFEISLVGEDFDGVEEKKIVVGESQNIKEMLDQNKKIYEQRKDENGV